MEQADLQVVNQHVYTTKPPQATSQRARTQSACDSYSTDERKSASETLLYDLHLQAAETESDLLLDKNSQQCTYPDKQTRRHILNIETRSMSTVYSVHRTVYQS